MELSKRAKRRDSRRFNLIDYLKERKKATINELTEHFDVSEVTLRKDIKKLKKLIPNITQKHGKVEWVPKEQGEELNPSYKQDLEKKKDAKNAVGSYIANSIPFGAYLAIGTGSTCYYIYSNFSKEQIQNLTITTSNLYILTDLAHEKPSFEDMYDIGGKVDWKHMGLARNVDKFNLKATLEGTGYPIEKDKLFEYCIISGKSLGLRSLELFARDPGTFVRENFVANSDNIFLPLTSDKILQDLTTTFSIDLLDIVDLEKQKIFVVVEALKEKRKEEIGEALTDLESKGISEGNFAFVIIEDDDPFFYGTEKFM